MLAAGDTAPDFTLPDQEGNELTLSDLRGQTVVLYFYPRADTPGCTTQALGVRDRRADYEAAGARVLGISPDEVEAVAKFAGKNVARLHPARRRRPRGRRRLRHLDREAQLRQDVLGRAASTFIIGADGAIVHVIPKASPKTHDDEVLAALAQATAT